MLLERLSRIKAGLALGDLAGRFPWISQRRGGSVLLRRPPAQVGQHSTGVDTGAIDRNGLHQNPLVHS
jgi:hypothetical protein